MDLATALKALETAGSEKIRATYARHGVTGPCYGVAPAALSRLAKEAGPDLELARALWASGNHDARLLATKVAPPDGLAAAELETWSRDLSCKALADEFARLAARTPGARDALLAFTKSPDEWIGRAGWIGVAEMAAVPGTFPEAELSGFISALEKGIHRAKNHVKDARLCLLVSIGALSDELEAKALAVARRIGPIDVDHGDTAGETPDPLVHIPKARAVRRAQQKKAEKAVERNGRDEVRAKPAATPSRPATPRAGLGATPAKGDAPAKRAAASAQPQASAKAPAPAKATASPRPAGGARVGVGEPARTAGAKAPRTRSARA